MTTSKICEFKAREKTINDIFYRYRMYKVKLINKELRLSKIDETCMENYECYIKAVDTVLGAMNTESAKIIQSLYLDKVDKNDLGFSPATFYSKFKVAANQFLDFFE